ncbi:YfgM family protein [Thalassotalea atypica]|uniref:YfgM family protein n=1 Tax=Thalassotalea atypica TaxID=2054316 RepID=UPI002572BB71|nr:tetratricopeptide repeat protein [Thalassotalea atypica]
MEVYQTEEQQVEAIKGFWKENGNAIIGGFAAGLAVFVGYNYYQEAKLDSELATADAFQEVLEKAVTDTQGFKTDAEQFIAANSESSYASLAALALAKESANEQDWDATASHLKTAVEKAPSEEIKALATIRLARVQIELSELEQALTTLSAQVPVAFNALFEETKGDVYVMQEKKDLARNAFQAAIDAGGLTTSPNLQMKLDDLAVTVNLPK